MEELKKVLLIGAHVGTFAGSILSDGKVDLKDLPDLFKALNEIRKLTEVDYDKALEQLKTLTTEQRAELGAEFAKEFDLPADQLEKKIEDIVVCVVGIASYILKLVDSCKDIKKLN